MPNSPTLAEYQDRLRARLIRIKQDVQRDMTRERASQSRREGSRLPASEPVATLAPGQGPSSPGDTPAAGSPGGRAGTPDWGPDLVELIERTIVPDFWDTNGGPGSIRYYYPLHALVVRATSEVHYRVGGLLEDLRAAGR